MSDNKIIILIKRFINWIKTLFLKKQNSQQQQKIEIMPVSSTIDNKKIHIKMFHEFITVGEKFLSDNENLCIKVSKLAFIEFKRNLTSPVIACYRKFPK